MALAHVAPTEGKNSVAGAVEELAEAKVLGGGNDVLALCYLQSLRHLELHLRLFSQTFQILVLPQETEKAAVLVGRHLEHLVADLCGHREAPIRPCRQQDFVNPVSDLRLSRRIRC